MLISRSLYRLLRILKFFYYNINKTKIVNQKCLFLVLIGGVLTNFVAKIAHGENKSFFYIFFYGGGHHNAIGIWRVGEVYA